MLHPKSLKSVAGLQTLGFEGFVPVSRLRHRRDDVPNVPGVYLVVSHPGSTPAFLAVGTGGHFKGKNPNEPIIRLQEEWVKGAIILYIGQTERTLKKRIDELIRFGQAEAIGHRGG